MGGSNSYAYDGYGLDRHRDIISSAGAATRPAGRAIPDFAGTWVRPNDPAPSGPLARDTRAPRPSDVDDAAIARASDGCADARIREELAACGGVPERLAALLEDALVHDAWAWPSGGRVASVRPTRHAAPAAVALTLPLPGEAYIGSRFADAPWTAPG